MAVHAVEPRCDPTAARLEKGDPKFRMTIAHAAPDHTHRRQHHFHRMADDVAGAAALEAVDADRRHAARCALVKADREIEILGRLPEWLVTRIVDHLVAIRVWPDKAAAEAQFLLRELHLLDRQL